MRKLLFCPKCGNRYEEEDRFCQECGYKRPESPAPVSAPADAPDDMLGGQVTLEEPVIATSSEIMSAGQVHTMMNQAYNLLGQGRKVEALELLKSARKKAEWNPEYLCLLGRTYRQTGNPSLAVVTYGDCICKHPEYPLAYTNCSVVYCDLGMYKEAERMCVSAITRFPKVRNQDQQSQYATTYANYAYAVGIQGRKEDAKRLIAEAERNGYTKCDALRQMLGIK